MTLLAFGCSVTHGTEIVASGNSKDNIPYSYPALIAKYLKTDCVNHAFCGNSNENIFHEAMETVSKYEDLKAVIVGWTSVPREVWKCGDRTWQFLPSWCSSVQDIWKQRPTAEEQAGLSNIELAKIDWGSKLHYISATDSSPSYCADQSQHLPILEKFYNLFMSEKFDIIEYTRKTMHYVTAFRAYCQINKVKLIETCWAHNITETVNIGLIGDWHPALIRHPNALEHQLFADQIIKHYKL